MSKSSPHLPTVLLSQLSERERDQYLQFLCENDVEFVQDEQGFYIATIRMINPESQPASLTKQFTSRALQPTFSSRQKSVIISSPRNSASPSRSRLTNASPLRSQSKEIQSRNLNNLGELFHQSEQRRKGKVQNLRRYLETSQFQKLLKLANISQVHQLRPKLLPINSLIKVIEEIYTFKYAKEVNWFDRETLRQKAAGLPEFIVEYYSAKYKIWRGIAQNVLDLANSVEFYKGEVLEVRTFAKFLTEEYNEETLAFYLVLRNAVSSVLGVHFYQKFPGDKGCVDCREVMLGLRQVSAVLQEIFKDEKELMMQFLKSLEGQLIGQGAQLHLCVFYELCISAYSIEQKPSPPLSPYKQTDSIFETFSESAIRDQGYSLETDSSDLMSGFFRGNLETPVKNSYIREFNTIGSANTTPSPSKNSSQINEFKEDCLNYINTEIVDNLIEVVLNPDKLSFSPIQLVEVQQEASSAIKRILAQLVECLFIGDKLRYISLLGVDKGNTEALKRVEGLQKEIRQASRLNLMGDAAALCRSLIKTPEIRNHIGALLQGITERHHSERD